MPRKDANTGPISAQAQQDLVSEGIENFELPKTIVTKIAKSAVPENTKLQKETVLSLVKGSTVFINYLAARAHDVAVSKQHKSISASDVLKALEMIEFGDLVDKLQAELVIYREQAKTDKSKKGSSNVNSAPIPSVKIRPLAQVSSAKGKGKDKEKLTVPLPPPFTSVPLHHAAESISTGSRMPMEVDWEEELGEAADAAATEGEGEREEDEGELEGADGEDDEAVDDGDNDEGDDGEVADDPMEVEEEELRKDAKGLEESSNTMVHD
ncbi:histone-fold-containing protein [Collybia nuda]|uniref:DNA polymerase epsilon subunit D n=1 Tax=Collybia nuda TaxID=64659 RepID=A0A9P6CMQ3_9AGAR|nr:histone-fold-containing protein [Collybia nuda]